MKKFIHTLIYSPLFLCAQTLLADEDAPPRDQGLWQTLIMITIALMFFYLILWRPEQKRRKAMDDLRNSMKKGDRVIAMGIIGTVYRIQDNSVILRMWDGSKIEVHKGAISEVTPATEEDLKKIEP